VIFPNGRARGGSVNETSACAVHGIWTVCLNWHHNFATL